MERQIISYLASHSIFIWKNTASLEEIAYEVSRSYPTTLQSNVYTYREFIFRILYNDLIHSSKVSADITFRFINMCLELNPDADNDFKSNKRQRR